MTLLIPHILLISGLLVAGCGSGGAGPDLSTTRPPQISVKDSSDPELPSGSGPKPIIDSGADTIPAIKRPDPLIPDVLPPLAEDSPLLKRKLKPIRKYCQDLAFGKDGLEACFLGEIDQSLSPFSSISLQFSLQRAGAEVLPRRSVEAAIELRSSTGELVKGALVWRDKRTLIFDPYEVLAANQKYILHLASHADDPNRPISSLGRLLTPLQIELQTGPRYDMEQSLNGYALDGKQGLVLSQEEHPRLVLRYRVIGSPAPRSLRLQKLGEGESQLLCQGNCGQETQALPLARLNPGLNAYQWIIEGSDGSTSYRQFSFHWGHTAADPAKVLSGQAVVALEGQQGLVAFSELLSRFASGSFTLDYQEPDGSLRAQQTFNQIMNREKASYPRDLPANCDRNAPAQFDYLKQLGPFCGLKIDGESPLLRGLGGSVKYTATADIYVSSMAIEERAGNVSASLQAGKESLLVRLGAQRFSGKLKVIIRISEARYLFGLSVPGATGYFQFDTDFSMNGPLRNAWAKTDLSQKNGRLQLMIRGVDSFDLSRTRNGRSERDELFDISEWNDNVMVSAIEQVDSQRGVWALLVNFVVNQAVREKVNDFKPQIVNGIARDMIQLVAPLSLNTLVSQFEKGLTVPFPYYLPTPLSEFKAIAAGSLLGELKLRQHGAGHFLETKLGLQLAAIGPQQGRSPDGLQGTHSFVRMGQKTVPVELKPEDLQHGGNVLAIHVDLINQALFRLWQSGLFHLDIDEEFTRIIERFAVFDPSRQQNGKEVLLAEFIPKLLGSSLERVRGIDQQGQVFSIRRDDKVRLRLEPKLPPHLKLEADAEGRPIFRLSLGETYVKIEGLQAEQSYQIAQMRLAFSARSRLSFGGYSNPRQLEAFRGAGALRLEIAGNPGEYESFIEILEFGANNPFGLDLPKLRDTVQPMVEELFIPLLNDALRELPVTGLRTCGLSLDLAKTELLAVDPRDTQLGHIRARVFFNTYPFEGHCALMPDYEVAPSALPDPPGTLAEPVRPNIDPVLVNQDDSGGAPSVRNLDFEVSQLPLAIGESSIVPEVAMECRKQVFFDISCAVAKVFYREKEGRPLLDERSRPIYDYTQISLYTLVAKAQYGLREQSLPSIETQFFAFGRWPEYAQGYEDNLVFKDSVAMGPQQTQYGLFKRHYVDYETNSPKASGFIPIRSVSLHRVLDKPFRGAKISTEFFADLSPQPEVPQGRRALKGAEGLDYHVGNIHVVDCAQLDWCGDSQQWLVIYDSKLRPEDKSIPEEVLPYLKAALNSILAGMFP